MLTFRGLLVLLRCFVLSSQPIFGIDILTSFWVFVKVSLLWMGVAGKCRKLAWLAYLECSIKSAVFIKISNNLNVLSQQEKGKSILKNKGLKIIWWEKQRKKVMCFSIIVYVHADIWQFSVVSVKQRFSFHWRRGKVISIYSAVISGYLEVRMCLRIGRAKQLVSGNLLHKGKSAICWSSVFKIYHAVQILTCYVCWFFK